MIRFLQLQYVFKVMLQGESPKTYKVINQLKDVDERKNLLTSTKVVLCI